MDRGFVIACPARSRWCGFTLKRVRKKVSTNCLPQHATGSNNNAGENQKRKGTALSLAPQAGGDRDRHFALRGGILCGVWRQWFGGVSAKATGIARTGSPNQGPATTKRRHGTGN